MRKLALNKETVRRLDDRLLHNVQGGNIPTLYDCFTIHNTCEPVTIGTCEITSPCPSLDHCKTWKC